MEHPVTKRPQASTVYVALTDIMSAAGLLFPVVFLVIAVVVTFTGGVDEARGFYWMSALGALIGFPFAWWRVQQVKTTLATGVEVDGVVTSIKTGSGRSGNTRVKWEYQYEGRRYEGEAYVAVDGSLRPPEKGRKIRLWVNPQKPQWSVWRDLYTTPLALGKE